MPKQKRKETQEEQSARFEARVRRMIDAGELRLTETEKERVGIISRSILSNE